MGPGLLRYHQLGLDGAKVGRDWTYVAISKSLRKIGWTNYAVAQLIRDL